MTAALLLSVMAFTGCQNDVTLDNVGDKISESVNDTITKTKKQVSDDLKSALADEVQAFLKSDDLAVTLGISEDERQSINDSIQGYIDNYEFDEEQLKAAKESVEEFLESAKGLSAEEIKKNIADIFEGSEK
ncbi:MAG: hypothetical protein K2N90_08565 [Lachnospiraceae bacterium]|nr:hypothetical protein [Lachnospiraceae bacterium]